MSLEVHPDPPSQDHASVEDVGGAASSDAGRSPADRLVRIAPGFPMGALPILREHGRAFAAVGGYAPGVEVTWTGGPEPLRLEIPPRLVERARALAPTLPDELARQRDVSAEEAVLRAALRLGLASLAALADEDED